MEHATEIVILAVSVLIVAIVLVLSLSVLNTSKELPRTMSAQMNEVNADMQEYQYLKYTNGTVSGSEVLSALRKLQGNGVLLAAAIKQKSGHVNNLQHIIIIESGKSWNRDTYLRDDVTGKMQTTVFDIFDYSASTDFSTFQNVPTSDLLDGGGYYTTYFNPIAEFKAFVTRRKNGTLKSLVFYQLEYVPPVSSGTQVASLSLRNYQASEETESSEDVQVNAAESISEESAVKTTEEEVDLEVIFSDEKEKEEETIAETSEDLVKELENLTEELDALITEIDEVSEDITTEQLKTFVEQLEKFKVSLDTLQEKAEASNELSDENKSFIKSNCRGLRSTIDSIINSFDLNTTEEVN